MKIDFTELFCFVDDFFKFCKRKNISTNGCNSKPGPVPRLNKSEVITIILGYTKSNFDCFKNYYEQYIMNYHRHDFDLVSYKRFNSLIGDYLPDLAIMLSSMLKECDGLSLVDSTSIAVCKNYRISSHKVFKSMASRGKTTKGWFYGIKMHIITNLQGELVKVSFTAGNKDDRKQLLAMSKGIFGKIFGDRGYISKKLFQELFEKKLHLITRIKRNMKNILMPLEDKILSCKRILIEAIIGRIKLLGKFEHTRHRSPVHAFVHMIAQLINYQLLDRKPSFNNLFSIAS